MKFQLYIIVLLQSVAAGAFVVPSKSIQQQQQQQHLVKMSAISRRNVVISSAGAPLIVLFLPQHAEAKDELFKKNPLTNAVLEQIRIWDQASADQLSYGGELAPGDAGNKGKVEQYPLLLVPILEIVRDIDTVYTLVQDPSRWPQVQRIVSDPKYEKLAMKKIFNAYGDNIYYSDPDRANVYLGGGATPRNEQTLAYLLRNDLLTNVECLQAEVAYLLKDGTPLAEKEHPDDLYMYAKAAKAAIDKYMELVPPTDLEKASAEMNSK